MSVGVGSLPTVTGSVAAREHELGSWLEFGVYKSSIQVIEEPFNRQEVALVV